MQGKKANSRNGKEKHFYNFPRLNAVKEKARPKKVITSNQYNVNKLEKR